MELKFELLQDIHRIWPPVTFFLFPKSKKWLTSNEEVIAQTDAYFEDLPKSYFFGGLKKFKKCLKQCIELKRDYVEKEKKIDTK